MAAPNLSPLEIMLSLAKKPAVTIILDGDPNSENSRMGIPFNYYKPDKILTIILSNINPEDQDQLLPIIRDVFDEGGLVLRDEQEEVLELYENYLGNNPDQTILDFFKDKLPYDDLSALKMSFFMRSEKERGANIEPYKMDIRERFGARGMYIANLCNAGYFENEFVPLYNNITPIQFRRKYEELVGEKARALFVHAGMTKGILQNYFDAMVEKALKYKLSDFRIHGFGGKNVDIIKQFLHDRIIDEDEIFEIVLKEEKQNPAAIEYDVIFN